MKKFEFSKVIVLFTFLLYFPAVAVLSWRVLELAELAIMYQFAGALPYLTAIITPAWAVIGVVFGFYYNKSKAENVTRETMKYEVQRKVDC